MVHIVTDPTNIKSLQVNSPISTSLSLLNSMIGGVMLVIPINFEETGIISSLIIISLSGYISYKTSSIYVTHLAPAEYDVQYSMARIAGRLYYQLFMIFTSLDYYMGNLLYFIYTSQMLYGIV